MIETGSGFGNIDALDTSDLAAEDFHVAPGCTKVAEMEWAGNSSAVLVATMVSLGLHPVCT